MQQPVTCSLRLGMDDTLVPIEFKKVLIEFKNVPIEFEKVPIEFKNVLIEFEKVPIGIKNVLGKV
ncbi:hypothetical protein AM500_04255 [Bacillus sp. FJAT-18017]|nr:hypothetical protein AM500_04255 [Bacillus sp. FJAT-18017]